MQTHKSRKGPWACRVSLSSLLREHSSMFSGVQIPLFLPSGRLWFYHRRDSSSLAGAWLYGGRLPFVPAFRV